MKIVTASQLLKINNKKNVSVAGLVVLRQKPGTAKGVVFLTLEDETGTINIICWEKVYQKYKTEIISAQLLRINGQLQRQNNIINIICPQNARLFVRHRMPYH